MDERANAKRGPRVLALFLVGWTIVAGLAMCWILRGHPGSSVLIIRDPDSPRPATTEQMHGWISTNAGLQRVYPWVLFGPYVALVVLYFPFERGRLRLNLPLNVAACAGFLAAAHAIDTRTRLIRANMTFIRTEVTVQGRVGDLNRYSEEPLREVMPSGPPLTNRAGRTVAIIGWGEKPSDAELTNFFARLPPGFRPPPRFPALPNVALFSTLLDLLAYGAIAGLAHSVHFYKRFRERERRALLLESTLARTRLEALRAQLQPHFLFNSLNAVATLLRRDPRLAEATLMSLSDLLRLALSHSERQEVALREELQFVQRYLEIQQTRFGEKLRVEQDFDPAVLDCLVPALMFQPLIENAIRHGLEPSEKSGLLRLSARRLGDKLVLTVEDDGVGLPANAGALPKPQHATVQDAATAVAPAAGITCAPADPRRGTGIGLANLRSRLEALYGTTQSLDLSPRGGGGVVVRIELPCHTAANTV